MSFLQTLSSSLRVQTLKHGHGYDIENQHEGYAHMLAKIGYVMALDGNRSIKNGGYPFVDFT